jgi:UDP:flavonoid glycosyltransferase YjiC (YdhE family)
VRVLFCSPPLMGHTLPMVPLALALQRAGHTVAWASGEDVVGLLAAQGLTVSIVSPSQAACRARAIVDWPERARVAPRELGRETAARLFGAVLAPAMLGPLEALLTQWQPDVVVHDRVTFAAPLACQRQHIPNVSHGFGLARPADAVAATQARLLPLWRAQGLVCPPDGGNFVHAHIDICPPSLRALAPQRDQPECPVWAMAPVAMPATETPATPRRRSLLMFGTVHHRSSAFDAALTAMAALASAELPVHVALGPGRAADTPAPTDTPHLHLQPWLDLASELPHCASLVCHGGAGTVLAALAHGVPVLLLPQAADHFRNADAVAALGAGLVLEGAEQCTPQHIGRAVRRLHTEPTFTAAAQRCALEIGAMPNADSVASSLLRWAGQRSSDVSTRVGGLRWPERQGNRA